MCCLSLIPLHTYHSSTDIEHYILSVRSVVLALLLTMYGMTVRAQNEAAFNHYWSLQSFYNPAVSGLDGQINIEAAYSMQMLGYTHAPATMTITADLPLWFISRKHGVGAGFVNDKIGLFAHKKFYAQYAFHQPLWGGRLSAGVRVGLLSESFDGTGLELLDPNDPAFPTSEANGTAFDLDVGLRYDGRQWYAGIAMMHVLSPTVSLGESKTNELNVPATYYLPGGYNIKLKNPLFKVHTSAILRTDISSAWRGDVTARLSYNGSKGNMYLGVGYSPTISASLFIGGNFHGVRLGYCYEIYTSGVGALQGTHEISLGYTTDLDLFKKGKNRHQSVRLL